MATVTDGRMPHFGTYNGNPLVMAAAAAVDEICTEEALGGRRGRQRRRAARHRRDHRAYELPAHTVGFGVKGAVTWSTTPVRTYRDYKRTDFEAAELSWLWGVNRGILTPPGLDEQWLVSLAHTPADMACSWATSANWRRRCAPEQLGSRHDSVSSTQDHGQLLES